MHHIWLCIVEEVGEGIIHGLVPEAVPGPGHVDHVKGNFRIGMVGVPLHRIFGEERVLFPGENVDLVPIGQRLCEALGIHLRTRVVSHRVTVNNLEDFQTATL